MKIDFQPIELSAYSLIQSYTLTSAMQNCDYAVANLCCWQFLYGSEYAIVDGWLLLRFRLEPHHKLAYMAPVGSGDLLHAIRLLANDAAAHGEALSICGASDEMKAELECALPGHFHYINDRDFNDYIYRRDGLATLAGKELQPKRNHVNKFTRLYPQFEFHRLTPEWYDDCLHLESRWQERQTLDDGQDNERRAMEYAFAHYEALGLIGGVLTVDGVLVAFSYGSPINADTFAVHVEKADTRYEGAYTVINQQFVKHLPEAYIHINREEDLGIEGLRRSKLSYAPELLLNKWMITQKPVVLAEAVLKQQLGALWKTVFQDDDAFLQRFAADFYRRDRVLFTMQDDRIVSSLYLLPLRCVQHPEWKLAYVYAVGTHPDYRGQGLMGLLLGRLRQHLKAEEYNAVLLRPADATLPAYYRRFGFTTLPAAELEKNEHYEFLHDPGEETPSLMVLPVGADAVDFENACYAL